MLNISYNEKLNTFVNDDYNKKVNRLCLLSTSNIIMKRLEEYKTIVEVYRHVLEFEITNKPFSKQEIETIKQEYPRLFC